MTVWQALQILSRRDSQGEFDNSRKIAWDALRKPGVLEAACRRAIDDPEYVLEEAWACVTAPSFPQVLQRFSPDNYRQIHRCLRGIVSAARAARSADCLNVPELRTWLQVTAAAWNGTPLPEVIPAPLSSSVNADPNTAGKVREALPAEQPVLWLNGMEPEKLVDQQCKELRQWPDPGCVGTAHDCVLQLLGKSRLIRDRRIALLGYSAHPEPRGVVIWLHVELMKDGAGGFYPDPCRMAFIPVSDDFSRTAQLAWTVACAQRDSPSKRVDVSWWVESDNLLMLEGGSAGAGFAVALVQLLRDDPVDERCAISAGILPGGSLQGVNHVFHKVQAAFKYEDGEGRRITRVLVHDDNCEEAKHAADKAGKRSDEQGDPGNEPVRTARTVADACEASSGLAMALRRYLDWLVEFPDQDKPVFLGERTFANVYRSPNVRKKVQPASPLPARPEARLSSDVLQIGEELPSKSQPLPTWKQEWETLKRGPKCRAAVLGQPGSGKSLLLLLTASQLAKDGVKQLADQEAGLDNVLLPIVVPLKILCSKKHFEGNSPDAAVRAGLREALRQGNCPNDIVDYLAKHAHEGRIWLFLDALDEVGNENGSLGKLLQVLNGWQTHIVIASRRPQFEGLRLPFGVLTYQLEPFSAQQIEAFVRGWYNVHRDQDRILSLLRRSPSLQEIGRIPFLLTLLCWVGERRELSSDMTRSQLYDRMLRDLLGMSPEAPGQPADELRAAQWLPLLGDIALSWFHENLWKSGVSSDWILKQLKESPHRPAPLGFEPEDLKRLSLAERAQYLLIELCKKRLLAPITAKRDAWFVPHRSILEHLAKWALDQAQPEERRSWAKKAITALNSGARVLHITYANWPIGLAEEEHARFIAEILMTLKEDDLDFDEAADLLNKTAFLMTIRKHFNDAIPLFERALAIRKKLYGDHHLKVAETLNHMADCYEDSGKHEKARKLYMEALVIREKRLGLRAGGVAEIHNNLGLSYFNERHHDQEAEDHYLRAKEIWGEVHDDCELGGALFNLAMLQKRRRKPDCENLFREALAKIKGSETSPVMEAQATYYLADFLADNSRDTEAARLFEVALRLREELLGQDDSRLLEIIRDYIPVLRRLGRTEEANNLEARAAEIRAKNRD